MIRPRAFVSPLSVGVVVILLTGMFGFGVLSGYSGAVSDGVEYIDADAIVSDTVEDIRTDDDPDPIAESWYADYVPGYGEDVGLLPDPLNSAVERASEEFMIFAVAPVIHLSVIVANVGVWTGAHLTVAPEWVISYTVQGMMLLVAATVFGYKINQLREFEI
jgi:hypothetical protein